MPLWLVRKYGLPVRGSGFRGVARVAPTAHARRLVRVEFLAWDRETRELGPSALRHVLALAVVRHHLGVAPGAWDNLATRTRRTTLRGRAWARRRLRGERVPRPDAEWWADVVRHDPVAVEVDTGKLPADRIRRRLRSWHDVYSGLVWVTFTEDRARRVGALLREVMVEQSLRLGFGGQVSAHLEEKWRVVALSPWWAEEARWEEVSWTAF